VRTKGKQQEPFSGNNSVRILRGRMGVIRRVPVSSENTSRTRLGFKRRRRISPETGRALEVLAHAIEYLIDMHEHEGSLIVWEEGHLEAVEILKTLNRQIYLECPVIPSFEERWCSFLFGKRRL
jgi:hypothetical protein